MKPGEAIPALQGPAAFRLRNQAAPLKPNDVIEGGTLGSPFRLRNQAAPLKRDLLLRVLSGHRVHSA